jgi:hypothetical protein
MGKCLLCDETPADPELVDHLRVMHPGQHEPPATWPDGVNEPAISDHDATKALGPRSTSGWPGPATLSDIGQQVHRDLLAWSLRASVTVARLRARREASASGSTRREAQ